MLMPIGLFLAVMYFMVLRPENKRRKETQAMLSTIKAGDKVVTTGGLHGVIHRLDERTVTLVVDNTKMTFDRAAIGRVDRGDAAGTQPPAK
ncbi:MAG: preprotein translocase subunit YajC [Planctomycetes bacterium]|nr:preprotein translocase subunit YajC [Planctomycetota bacterium]